MAKPLKSQWDFGELFPPETLRKIFTVSELTLSVKTLLERQVGRVWVTGEITNWRIQNSGHAYFALKDVGAQLSCVLFRAEARSVDRTSLRDGQKVVAEGDVTVYEARGQYQLRVTNLELQGVGALQIAFEKLKQKLQAEGLFAMERKQRLPRYPRRIGLVTSPTGAAIRDVLHVIERRNPSLEVVLAPCRVQGQGAADEIAVSIRRLNEWHDSAESDPARALDLILVTRGGGSLEDLWAFNEEIVARAIFESTLPVVSAVGHEIDFSIADFVADVRAATPSVAAELVTEGAFASREFVAGAPERLRYLIGKRLDSSTTTLAGLLRRLDLVHPRRRLAEHAQRLDDVETALSRSAKSSLRFRLIAWHALCQRLLRVKPTQVIAGRREHVEQLQSRLPECVRISIKSLQARLAGAEGRLRLLSPENVLQRGYSITSDAVSGKILHAAAETKAGQRIRTRLKSGEIRSVVES